MIKVKNIILNIIFSNLNQIVKDGKLNKIYFIHFYTVLNSGATSSVNNNIQNIIYISYDSSNKDNIYIKKILNDFEENKLNVLHFCTFKTPIFN